jgi:ribonuclease inhibitor
MKHRPAKTKRVRLDPTHASMDAIYTHLQRALAFPDHFGRNLDALWDVMHDVPGPIEIRWKGHAQARSQLGEKFDALVVLFRDLENERSDFKLVLE